MLALTFSPLLVLTFTTIMFNLCGVCTRQANSMWAHEQQLGNSFFDEVPRPTYDFLCL